MHRKLKKLLITASVIGITIFSTLLIIPNKAEKYTSLKAHIVESGDTLWSIAREYQPEGDVRKLVYEIGKVNDIKAHELKEGQELLIPKK